MKRFTLIGFCLSALLVAALSGLSASPAFGMEVETVRVFEKIFTVSPKSGTGANSTFIITKDGVVVVDSGASPEFAEKVLGEIKARTDQPVRLVINTNFHADYVFGNQAFRPNSDVLAHENARKNMLGKSGYPQRTEFKALYEKQGKTFSLAPPNQVFQTGMEIYPGEFHLQLLHPGRGFTDSDTAVYIKEYRLLILGGWGNREAIPDLRDAYIGDWIKNLRVLEDLDAEMIVPGLGRVGEKPIMIHMKHYLLELKTHVVKFIRAGKTLAEGQDAVEAELKKKFGSWKHQDRIRENIKKAYREFHLPATSMSSPGGGV